MEAYGGFLVDEKAVRVENAFLEFLKRFSFSFFTVFFFFFFVFMIMTGIPVFWYLFGGGVKLENQLQVGEPERAPLRGGDRSDEGQRVQHHVHRFRPRHQIQRPSPKSHLRWIFKVFFFFFFLGLESLTSFEDLGHWFFIFIFLLVVDLSLIWRTHARGSLWSWSPPSYLTITLTRTSTLPSTTFQSLRGV